MTREEVTKYIKSKLCEDCGIYLGGGECRDNCKVNEAIKAFGQTPCDLCMYNPPSISDGKPCIMCPACGRGEEE